MGCFTPPIELAGELAGHLLTFYNAYPPKYPGDAAGGRLSLT